LEQSKPLLGVPFSNKNNMDVKGFVSVAGYAPFVNNPPAEKDCDVVERFGFEKKNSWSLSVIFKIIHTYINSITVRGWDLVKIKNNICLFI